MMSLTEMWNNIFKPKAISHRPDLAGRVHISTNYADRVSVSIEDYADYARVYEVYVWVHKAIQKTAEQIASKRVQVVDVDNEPIDNHPLVELFEYYNDSHRTIEDGWQAYVVDMMLAGEAAFELVVGGNGAPVEMWHRRPDKLAVLPDKSRLMYPQPAGYSYGDSEVIIPPENIWHTKFYNPLNPWRGLAPIKAIREGIIIDLFAQAWHKKFLKDGARPDFAIIAPEGLTRTEKEDYEELVISRQSGPDGWHRPMVLERGIVDIKPFSWAPKDIEWLEQRKFSRDEVGALFGMPDEIMGYGRDTYENFNTAWQVWWSLTLKPLIDQRDRSLQSFFTKVRPLLQPGEFVQTDLSDVGALQEDIAPKVEIAERLFKMGVPFNILDERLGLGIGEIPGGDVPYVNRPPQFSDEPQQLAYTQKKKTPSPYELALSDWYDMASKAIEKNGQVNRVYFDERIPQAVSYKLAVLVSHCRSTTAIDALFSNLDEYLDTKAILDTSDTVDPTRLGLESGFVGPMQDWLQEQVRRIVRGLGINSEPPGVEFWKQENTLLTAMLLPFVGEWVEASIAQQAELLSAVSIGLDANVNARAAEWAGKHGLNLAKGLNATTKELARAKIRNWAVSGRSMNDLIDDLSSVISPRWRAELIASTEVTRAYSEAVEEIAVETDTKNIVWLTARDERVCPICGPLHGANKKRGGVFAGGYDRPPAHPRCRCWLSLDV